MTFFDYLKNIFFFLIFIQITPPIIQNIKTKYDNFMQPKTRVAVITLSGTIQNASFYSKQLNTHFNDETIRAILIKIDSPGGSTGSSKAIYDDILALKKLRPKPIISLVENVCASGAYYVACATDHIIAPSISTIGSIGSVLSSTFKLDEFIKQYKIGFEDIHAGEFKQSGNPFVAMTPEQKKLLQSMVDDTYQQFIKDVAERRNLKLAEHNLWADARIFTGRQALDAKLIDQLGSEQAAIQLLKEKTGMTADDEIEWVQHKKPSTLSTLLTGEESDGGQETSFIKSVGSVLFDNLSFMKSAEQLCAFM